LAATVGSPSLTTRITAKLIAAKAPRYVHRVRHHAPPRHSPRRSNAPAPATGGSVSGPSAPRSYTPTAVIYAEHPASSSPPPPVASSAADTSSRSAGAPVSATGPHGVLAPGGSPNG
jgi:hypothetical protein